MKIIIITLILASIENKEIFTLEEKVDKKYDINHHRWITAQTKQTRLNNFRS